MPRLFLPLLSIIILIGISSCQKQKTDSGMTVAVIPKGTTHEFWKSVHAGAVKARQELAREGVSLELIWKGPLREDDREQQIQVVENFIGRKVSGIVLAPLDEEALVAPVEAAARGGIPVVIIDSDVKTSQRISFVATDNYKGGASAGEYLGKLLNGRGRVIMLRYQTGSASTEAREAGFLETVRKEYPDIQILSADQYGGATRETAYKAAQNLLNRYGRQVEGIFTPNESVTVGMLLALRDLGRAGGEVKLIGFDAGSQLVEALRKGDIQGLVVQNPMRMGYEGVMSLVRHLQGKEVPQRVDTGVMLVTPETMSRPDIQELLSPPLDKYREE